MPPSLALLLTACFVVFLFRSEHRRNGAFPRELWVPLIWLFLAATRFTSQWFGVLFGAGFHQQALTEGSLLDAAVFLALIVSGVRILSRRGVTLSEALRFNLWLTLFLAWGLVAVLWSDYPLVACKRWIKVLGHPVMALVVMTSADPVAAFRALMKRLAILLVPLSVMLIKYFPHIGRGFDPWSGMATNNGACLSKNELGMISVMAGIFLLWNLLETHRSAGRAARKPEMLFTGVLLGLCLWLIVKAGSAAALVCTVAGGGTAFALHFGWVKPRRLGTWVIAGALAYILLEPVLGIYTTVIQLLGRNPNLTDRTEVWADALALVENPLIGAGFESFWLPGRRLDVLWSKWWWQPNQAHNGYLETYLNLGLIGTFLLAGMIYSAFRTSQRNLCAGSTVARLHLALLAAILLFNLTEATFKAVAPLWTLFCMTAMAVPRRTSRPVLPHAAAVPRTPVSATFSQPLHP